MKGTEALQTRLLAPDKHSKHEKECETKIHFEHTGIWKFLELDAELDDFHPFSEVSSSVVNNVSHQVSSTILIASGRATTETVYSQNLHILWKKVLQTQVSILPAAG